MPGIPWLGWHSCFCQDAPPPRNRPFSSALWSARARLLHSAGGADQAAPSPARSTAKNRRKTKVTATTDEASQGLSGRGSRARRPHRTSSARRKGLGVLASATDAWNCTAASRRRGGPASASPGTSNAQGGLITVMSGAPRARPRASAETVVHPTTGKQLRVKYAAEQLQLLRIFV